MKEKNRKWLKETGGIDGQLLGLEADAAPIQRIEDLFTTRIQDLGKIKHLGGNSHETCIIGYDFGF